MKNANEIKDSCIQIRLDKESVKAIKAQAALENMSTSEYVRTSVLWYLRKDVNYKSQLEATVESLRTVQQKCLKELEMLSSLFRFWTRYYFTLTQGLEDMPESVREIRIDKGLRQSEAMMKSFRRELKDQKPGVIEALVADYLVQPEENNN